MACRNVNKSPTNENAPNAHQYKRVFVEMPLTAAIEMISRKAFPTYLDKMKYVLRVAVNGRTIYGARLKRQILRIPDCRSDIYHFHKNRAPEYFYRRYGIRMLPNETYLNVSPSEHGMELVPVSYVTVYMPVYQKLLHIMMEKDIPFSFVDEESLL